MKKFKVIQSFSSIPVDTILEPNGCGDYIYTYNVGEVKFTLTDLTDIIGEYVQIYEPIKMEVIKGDLDDTTKSNWKIVLQVKCTEKKLVDIKKFVEGGIRSLMLLIILFIIPFQSFSTIFIEGTNKEKKLINKSIKYGIKNSPTFKYIYDELSHKDIYIGCNSDTINEAYGNRINIDVHNTGVFLGENEPISILWLTIGHELTHIWLGEYGIVKQIKEIGYKSNGKNDLDMSIIAYCLNYNRNLIEVRIPHEEYATMIENMMRTELHLMNRCVYGDLYLITYNKTIQVEDPLTCEVILYEYNIIIKGESIRVYTKELMSLRNLPKLKVVIN